MSAPTMRSWRLAARMLVALAMIPVAAALAATRVVGASEFRSWNSENHYFEFAGGFVHGVGGAGTGCMAAAISFPAGSVLRSLTGHFYDNEASFDLRVDLYRKQRGNTINAASLAAVGTVGASGGVMTAVDLTIETPVVDDGFVYYFATLVNCMDSANQRLYDVVVELDEAIFLDGFESGGTTGWGGPVVQRRWLSGASFGSEFDPGWNKTFQPLWGTVTLPTENNDLAPCLIAPVELPHGAVVQSMSADLYDDRNDKSLTLELRRAPMASAVAASAMALVTTSTSGGWQHRTDTTIANATIDNDSYWYYLEACVSGGTAIGEVDLLTQAVEIVYSLP